MLTLCVHTHWVEYRSKPSAYFNFYSPVFVCFQSWIVQVKYCKAKRVILIQHPKISWPSWHKEEGSPSWESFFLRPTVSPLQTLEYDSFLLSCFSLYTMHLLQSSLVPTTSLSMINSLMDKPPIEGIPGPSLQVRGQIVLMLIDSNFPWQPLDSSFLVPWSTNVLCVINLSVVDFRTLPLNSPLEPEVESSLLWDKYPYSTWNRASFGCNANCILHLVKFTCIYTSCMNLNVFIYKTIILTDSRHIYFSSSLVSQKSMKGNEHILSTYKAPMYMAGHFIWVIPLFL